MRIALILVMWAGTVFGQDAMLAQLRVVISDPTGARVAYATVRCISAATSVAKISITTQDGNAVCSALDPGVYTVSVEAQGFAAQKRNVELAVGAQGELLITLAVGTQAESVTVQAAAPETDPAGLSTVITQKEIEELPVNGRRFADLAMLSPQAVQDPRSLTSTSNGDLSFGGIRGYQTSTIVDGTDNNNGFFAQSRGRLRAPYQFSNEIIKEFRVSTNTFGVEQGRASGAVVNVVTKSGTNSHHGSAFYYLRDGRFAATHPFVRKAYPDKQHQFGFSIGGPVKQEKIFYFAGFDQHIFHVPSVVNFLNGSTTVVPGPGDYESGGFFPDQVLVTNAAAQLSKLGGQFRSELSGNAAFLKLDFQLTPHHKLTTRSNASRYYGSNNVFFDPSSPINTFAISGNGEENVFTATASAALNSEFGSRWTNVARLQLARDDQASHANTNDVDTKIQDIISGFGRSSILPRSTVENRIQLTDTLSQQGNHHNAKMGADLHFTRTSNYFPRQFGGEYIFDNIKVNPFTFKPQLAGLLLTPLRAYAHQVPRYYIQDFGSATTHPDTNEFAAFAQDTARFGNHLSVTLGVRYDLQTFRQTALPATPLWPMAGKMPSDHNNVAPRLGIAASFGDHANPFVLRGGFGIFYPRIPQIYNSAVEAENGTRSEVFLDNSNATERPFFPAYPKPLVACGSGAQTCTPPDAITPFLTTEISSFAPNFKSPYVQQASLSVEKQIAPRTSVTLAYLFVGGRHLLRARDVNLPTPTIEMYPVYDTDGTTFTGDYFSVASFGTWQKIASLSCPIPPCINAAARPNPALGAVNVFETSARSTYHGFTLSAERRFANSFTARLGYTFAKAFDDTQDALVAGRPSVVENSFNLPAERSLSVTDQRHRFVTSFVAEPNPFGRTHAWLARGFNDWRFSGIFSAGSGRPLSGQINGDANRDGNALNDRLPGVRRNSYTGPDYFSGEARITRRFHLNEQWRLEATLEAFNVFNRDNQKVESSDDGYTSTAAAFINLDSTVGGVKFPAHFQKQPNFLVPNDAYSPRQVQISLRLKW